MTGLRFISKYSRNCFTKFISKPFIIFLMSYLYKLIDCILIQCIYICLIIKPWCIPWNFQPCRPYLTCFIRFFCFQTLIRFQPSLFIQDNSVASKKKSILTPYCFGCRHELLFLFFIHAFWLKHQKSWPILYIFCNNTSRTSRWPAIFII